jgi:hypothetical protein
MFFRGNDLTTVETKTEKTPNLVSPPIFQPPQENEVHATGSSPL